MLVIIDARHRPRVSMFFALLSHSLSLYISLVIHGRTDYRYTCASVNMYKCTDNTYINFFTGRLRFIKQPATTQFITRNTRGRQNHGGDTIRPTFFNATRSQTNLLAISGRRNRRHLKRSVVSCRTLVARTIAARI